MGDLYDARVDQAATEIVAAFQSACDHGLATVECYQAGVAVWKRIFPDHQPAYAARRAVEIMLSVRYRDGGAFHGLPRSSRA